METAEPFADPFSRANSSMHENQRERRYNQN